MLILFLVLRLVVILLGWLVIPPMALFHKYTTQTETSIINGRTILNFKYKWMFPWNNNEDGVLAGEELIGYPDTIRIIYWTAWRNPANNLRFIKHLSVKINPEKVKFIGTKYVKDIDGVKKIALLRDYDKDKYRFFCLTWQGMYYNIRFQWKMFGKIWRFWVGWKLYPHDKLGLPNWDYRRYGAGFATQFKRIYPRGE